MSWSIEALFAIPFALADETLTVKVGGVTYTPAFTGAGRTYRMVLAPTSGATRDLLREVAAVLTAASGATWTLALDTTTGKVRATVAAGSAEITAVGSDVWAALGFTADKAGTSMLADQPPQHLGIAVSAWGGRWRARRPGGAARTGGGRVFSFAAGRWTFDRTWSLDLVPWTPEDQLAVESPATPWRPTLSALELVGIVSGRGPTWLDLVHEAANRECAWCDDATTALATASTPYLLGYVSEETLLEPQEEPLDPTWPVYRQGRLELVTAGTTSTRT